MPSRDRAPGLAAVSSAVVLGSIMAVLDVTVVNVAVDRLSSDLHASLASVQCVSSGYTLALAAVMPASAWAIDRFGARRVYLACLGLFSAGSALSAAAPSIQWLIACRVLQGLGGGMLMPTGMTLIFRAAGRDRVGLASRILGIPLIVGPALGPTGGVLVDAISWRALFAVNVPIGLAALALGLRHLPSSAAASRPRRLDRVGLLLLSPGLALIILGLSRGSSGPGLTGWQSLGPAGAGVVLIASFLARTLRSADPLIDLRLLRRPSTAAALAVSCVFACGYFGSMFLAPLYFQLARGRSVAVSGLLVMPLGACSAVAMQLAGRVIDRVGAARIVLCGVPAAAAGLTAFVLQLAPSASYWGLGAALGVMGAGVGTTLMPSIAAANRELAPDQVPSGNTLIQVCSQLAAAVGTAVTALALGSSLASRISGAAGNGLGAAQRLAPAQLHAHLGAIVDAFQSTYVIGIALLAASWLPAVLLFRAGRAPSGRRSLRRAPASS